MAKEQTVTIPVEEYKELLLREMPVEKDKALVNAIVNVILEFSKIVDENSWDNDFKTVHINDENKFVKELLRAIYYTDRTTFISIYKVLASASKEDEINKLNMEYLRRIKEMKNERNE